MHHFSAENFAVGVLVALDTVAAPGTPLLKEEGGMLGFRLTFDIKRPFFSHRTCLWTALATNNYPVDSIEIELAEVF